MSFLRVLLAIIFPPLSVIGKGCGSFLIVFSAYPLRLGARGDRGPCYPQQS